jgi:maleylpyruvate isomerase
LTGDVGKGALPMADVAGAEGGATPSPASAIDMCQASHRRLFASIAEIGDDVVRRPSLLPDWTVGHVLTHLARNADGHSRRLQGALRGEDVTRYPGGMEQRGRDIEEGSSRSAGALRADVGESALRLEETWRRSVEAGWPNTEFFGADRWPTTESPLRRLREAEVHHVDLGLGYRPEDWPEPYVRWELERVLSGLPRRLGRPGDANRLIAWVIGRAEAPGVDLLPW